MALSQPQPIFLHQLQQDLITYDPYKEFPSTTGPNSKLQHKQGFWFSEGRLLIPATSTIRTYDIKGIS